MVAPWVRVTGVLWVAMILGLAGGMIELIVVVILSPGLRVRAPAVEAKARDRPRARPKIVRIIFSLFEMC